MGDRTGIILIFKSAQNAPGGGGAYLEISIWDLSIARVGQPFSCPSLSLPLAVHHLYLHSAYLKTKKNINCRCFRFRFVHPPRLLPVWTAYLADFAKIIEFQSDTFIFDFGFVRRSLSIPPPHSLLLAKPSCT